MSYNHEDFLHELISNLQKENRQLKDGCQKLIEVIVALKIEMQLRIVRLQGQYAIMQGVGNFESAIFVSEETGKLLSEVLGE